MSKRLDWVDIAKGFSIIAVVLLHIQYTFPNYTLLPLGNILGFAWHVPVFFLIGGFFLKEEKLIRPKEFIMQKGKSLYLMTLYFYVPAIVLHNVLIYVGWYDPTMSYDGKMVSEFTPPILFKTLIESLLCAGREPILGAMWFVYVLFMALCCLSVISWMADKLCNKIGLSRRDVLPVVLLILCIISATFSHDLGMNIPRCNNVFTAMWMVYLGYMLRNRIKLNFDNMYAFIASLFLFYHYCIAEKNGVALNGNVFSDVIRLSCGSIAALYVVCFVAQRIQGSVFGNVIRMFGKESFYIMSLQFVGFKLGMHLLNLLGYNCNIGLLKPETNNNILLLLYYTLFGLMVPLLFMWCFRHSKRLLTSFGKSY